MLPQHLSCLLKVLKQASKATALRTQRPDDFHNTKSKNLFHISQTIGRTVPFECFQGQSILFKKCGSLPLQSHSLLTGLLAKSDSVPQTMCPGNRVLTCRSVRGVCDGKGLGHEIPILHSGLAHWKGSRLGVWLRGLHYHVTVCVTWSQ